MATPSALNIDDLERMLRETRPLRRQAVALPPHVLRELELRSREAGPVLTFMSGSPPCSTFLGVRVIEVAGLDRAVMIPDPAPSALLHRQMRLLTWRIEDEIFKALGVEGPPPPRETWREKLERRARAVPVVVWATAGALYVLVNVWRALGWWGLL